MITKKDLAECDAATLENIDHQEPTPTASLNGKHGKDAPAQTNQNHSGAAPAIAAPQLVFAEMLFSLRVVREEIERHMEHAIAQAGPEAKNQLCHLMREASVLSDLLDRAQFGLTFAPKRLAST